jgi:hypothetical protein
MGSPAGAHLKGWNVAEVHHSAVPRPSSQFYRDLESAKQSHADVLRVEILSQQMQNAMDIQWMTRYLRTIRRLGMKVDLRVESSSNTSVEQFTATCAKAAQLWKDDLTAIELGNEPNALLQSSMTRAEFEDADAQAAAAYVPVVKDSYLAIKRVAPRLTVIAGAIAFSDGTFLEDAYADGMGGYFDALSVHPYTYNASPAHIARSWPGRMFSLVDGVPWIHDIMAQHGDGQKRVWLTEVGWNTLGDSVARAVSDPQRARYVGQLGAITRRWPWVAAVMFYDLRHRGPSSPDSGWAFVSQSWKPSLSFWAFARTTF